MTKITAGLLITLDGVIEAPEKWNPPYDNDEMTQVVMGQMADADTQLYGRRTYESFRTVFTGPSAPPHGQACWSTRSWPAPAGTCSREAPARCRSRSSNPGHSATVSSRSATPQAPSHPARDSHHHRRS